MSSFHHLEILQLKDMALKKTQGCSRVFGYILYVLRKKVQILYTCKDHITEYTKVLNNSLT